MAFVSSGHCHSRSGSAPKEGKKSPVVVVLPVKPPAFAEQDAKICERIRRKVSEGGEVQEFLDCARSWVTKLFQKLHEGDELDRLVAKQMETLTRKEFEEWKSGAWKIG